MQLGFGAREFEAEEAGKSRGWSNWLGNKSGVGDYTGGTIERLFLAHRLATFYNLRVVLTAQHHNIHVPSLPTFERVLTNTPGRIGRLLRSVAYEYE